MKVDAEPEVETMETISPPPVAPAELFNSQAAPRPHASHPDKARDSLRFQVALTVSLAILLGVMLYGTFGRIL
jgi:hypothetical protein